MENEPRECRLFDLRGQGRQLGSYVAVANATLARLVLHGHCELALEPRICWTSRQKSFGASGAIYSWNEIHVYLCTHARAKCGSIRGHLAVHYGPVEATNNPKNRLCGVLSHFPSPNTYFTAQIGHLGALQRRVPFPPLLGDLPTKSIIYDKLTSSHQVIMKADALKFFVSYF
mgnify:CR=1 FL=1